LARNTKNRLSAQKPDTTPPPQATTTPTGQGDALSFIVPTEFVDLPSQGAHYDPTHPLHGLDTIEIKFMTAKEEDILTSQTLLEKGLALDRLTDNLIMDKRIRQQSLLTGDKNAILIAARKSGFGTDYETSITCPSCTKTDKYVYDLDNAVTTTGLTLEDMEENDITTEGTGAFKVTLPKNPVEVEFQLLTGAEERAIANAAETRRRKKEPEQMITDQLKLIIVSVNGYTEPALIDRFVDSMTLADSRFLRAAYAKVNPNIELKEVFVCNECGHSDEIIFPFTADFFWPDR
jgi:hypothetical protein